MVHLSSTLNLLLTGLLACSAEAAARADRPVIAKVCARDSCYNQVFALDIPGRPAQGAKDCTLYLQSTVIPCPATSITTVTASSLASVRYTTSTSTITTTLVTSQTDAAAVTTTITPTVYTTQTSTITTTVSTSMLGNKRGLLDARTAPTCPTTTVSMRTNAPRYASDCTGTRFSSVCSCNGQIPTAAVTAPVSTVTSTSTLTIPYTTLLTTTITSTSTLSSVVLISITNTITETASVITSTSLTTTTLTQTSTKKYMEASTPCPVASGPNTNGNTSQNKYCVGAASNNCLCLARVSSSGLSSDGICSNRYDLPEELCSSDSDCSNGRYCLAQPDYSSQGGYRKHCVVTSSCVPSN